MNRASLLLTPVVRRSFAPAFGVRCNYSTTTPSAVGAPSSTEISAYQPTLDGVKEKAFAAQEAERWGVYDDELGMTNSPFTNSFFPYKQKPQQRELVQE